MGVPVCCDNCNKVVARPVPPPDRPDGRFTLPVGWISMNMTHRRSLKRVDSAQFEVCSPECMIVQITKSKVKLPPVAGAKELGA